MSASCRRHADPDLGCAVEDAQPVELLLDQLRSAGDLLRLVAEFERRLPVLQAPQELAATAVDGHTWRTCWTMSTRSRARSFLGI